MSQNATSKSLIQVADIQWPSGFGTMLPDDGSLLEPSKCLLIVPGDTFEFSRTLDLQIDVANNFGEALPEAAYLILSLTMASASEVLSATEILLPANSTTITVSYVLPTAPGAYQVSVFDKRTGNLIQGSPRTIIVAGTC